MGVESDMQCEQEKIRKITLSLKLFFNTAQMLTDEALFRELATGRAGII